MTIRLHHVAVFRILPAARYPAWAAYGARMAKRPAHIRAMARSGPQDLYAHDFCAIPHG